MHIFVSHDAMRVERVEDRDDGQTDRLRARRPKHPAQINIWFREAQFSVQPFISSTGSSPFVCPDPLGLKAGKGIFIAAVLVITPRTLSIPSLTSSSGQPHVMEPEGLATAHSVDKKKHNAGASALGTTTRRSLICHRKHR
jgi:hypothetical protein